jgi:hypothetical protein
LTSKVKKGGLAVMAGGEVKADGKFSGGKEARHGSRTLRGIERRKPWEFSRKRTFKCDFRWIYNDR